MTEVEGVSPPFIMLDIYSDLRNDIIYPYTNKFIKIIIILAIILLVYVVLRKIKRIIEGYMCERRLNKSEYEQYVSGWFTEEEIECALGECHARKSEREKGKNKFKI